MLIRIHPHTHALFTASSDHNLTSNARALPLSAKLYNPLPCLRLRLDLSRRNRRRSLCPIVCSCEASSHYGDDDDEQFIEASLLLSETFRHYYLWKQGFVEEEKWHSPGQMHPFSVQSKQAKSDISSIGQGFLRRFQSPTIFLKIDCDVDLVLPIIVGEHAINKLQDWPIDDKNEDCPDEYQFVKHFLESLGYEVKMVRIIERVVNTYYARIFIGKPAMRAELSLDARPSDAINMAKRFKAPIYVSKEIVRKDAIKIVYGTWRGSNVKTVYDVTLDSAAEGSDAISEELDLLKRMDAAILEERYEDAALLRDLLTKLRMARNGL